MCIYCNNKGFVTAVLPQYVCNRMMNIEYAVKCICNGGSGERWKYPIDMELTDKEKEIYLKLKKGKKVELNCPF